MKTEISKPKKHTSGTPWSPKDYTDGGYTPLLGLRFKGDVGREVYSWLKSQPSAAIAVQALVIERLNASKTSVSKKSTRKVK